MYSEQGCFVHLAEQVKETVNIPVIAVGRIKDPAQADQIIRDGKADMVSMGRAQLADPDLANKAEAGRLADIRPCLGCCMGCIHQCFLLAAATCVMNPAVNREYLLKELKKADYRKKILVVGAGPSGLAVSRLAGLRGHQVTIIEEKTCIGGMLRFAAMPPGRSEFLELIKYYERELQKLENVEIRLNVRLDNGVIDSLDPDAAVLTSGSMPQIPQLQGLLDTEMDLHTIIDVLDKVSAVTEPTIVLGGGQVGLQVADFLAEQGTDVVVLHRENHFAPEMAANDRVFLMERLKTDRVKLYKNVRIKEFMSNGVVFYSSGELYTFDGFKHIVVSEGMQSIRQAADLLKYRKIEVHIIGDAKSPRGLLESQSEADELGRTI
jgi:NADPH-dependent 2,4-dienoyl-CoA reductase/sulfur reductase-like enzyme